MTRLLIHAFLIMALLQLSCKKENMLDCFKGTGDIVRIERTVDDFHSIDLTDKINLVITPGAVFKVEIEGGEKLVGLVRTESADSTLKIWNDNTCEWSRSYQNDLTVYISLPKLNYLRFSGDGVVSFTDTLRSDSLTLDLWGAGGSVDVTLDVKLVHLNIHTTTGDITARGKCNVGYYYLKGNGFIFAEELETTLLFMGNHGTGDVYVNVTELLDVKMTYIGDVYYTGSPAQIIEKTTHTGRLIKL